MNVSDVDKAKVKLITLLNVASARNASKRKTGEDWHEIARRAKKSKAAASEADKQGDKRANGLVEVDEQVNADEEEKAERLTTAQDEQDDDEDENGELCMYSEGDRGKDLIDIHCFGVLASADSFKRHFATENKLITPVSLEAAESSKWATAKISRPALGQLVQARLDLPSWKKEDSTNAPVVSRTLSQIIGIADMVLFCR